MALVCIEMDTGKLFERYVSAQKLERKRSKSFPVSISLQTKAKGASLESPGMENIPQVPGNLAKAGQNHDARTAVSATLSVLK